MSRWGWTREVAEDRTLEIKSSRAARSASLVNNFNYRKNMIILNKQSGGLLGKICSIVNLFLMVHSAQHSAEKPTQKMRLFCPIRLAASGLSSAKEFGAQETPNQVLIQYQANLAKTHPKKIWSESSKAEQRAQWPEPGPFRFRIWSAVGNLRLKACHMKILILGSP